jgi:hypothetical protein
MIKDGDARCRPRSNSGILALAKLAILKERPPAARLAHPAFAAIVTALASGLDVLEPANTPHYRQFCTASHSLAS